MTEYRPLKFYYFIVVIKKLIITVRDIYTVDSVLLLDLGVESKGFYYVWSTESVSVHSPYMNWNPVLADVQITHLGHSVSFNFFRVISRKIGWFRCQSPVNWWLFTKVWMITCWTRDCQSSPSPKELGAHRD